MSKKPNPRRQNGARRDALRKRLLASQDVCALCGLPVDKSLKCPHPMSAEVDEIIPVSKGGSPFDASNVQLAHRICNQRKGNGDRGTHSKQTTNRLPLPTSRDW
jgi:5-methylcytosine-specific restriction endonuclease McrA